MSISPSQQPSLDVSSGDRLAKESDVTVGGDAVPPETEYFGFALYVGSLFAFILYIVWATLPRSALYALHIYYYPSRWWALAIPCYIAVTMIYIYVALASYNTEVLTKPVSQLCVVTDSQAKVITFKEYLEQSKKEGEYSINNNNNNKKNKRHHHLDSIQSSSSLEPNLECDLKQGMKPEVGNKLVASNNNNRRNEEISIINNNNSLSENISNDNNFLLEEEEEKKEQVEKQINKAFSLVNNPSSLSTNSTTTTNNSSSSSSGSIQQVLNKDDEVIQWPLKLSKDRCRGSALSRTSSHHYNHHSQQQPSSSTSSSTSSSSSSSTSSSPLLLPVNSSPSTININNGYITNLETNHTFIESTQNTQSIPFYNNTNNNIDNKQHAQYMLKYMFSPTDGVWDLPLYEVCQLLYNTEDDDDDDNDDELIQIY